MIEMTLSSRHRIRNSNGEETFYVSFKPPRPGHFTSHDTGEMPHIMFLYIAPIKWTIWLGLYKCCYLNLENFALAMTLR